MRIFFWVVMAEFYTLIIMGQTVYILLLVILLLSAGLLYVHLGSRKLRMRHRDQVARLESVIVSLTAEGGQQLDQLRLSDELMEQIRQARARLDGALIGLQEDYARELANGKR